uniref:Uncharacterized protein n=1 Tax=viral metagenome TaxID=1070528 RepID=A0A6C0B7X6_9ZZZZ
MLGYVVFFGLLYLFLQFQIDKIRDPKHPNKRKNYKEWIKKIKESVKV